MEGFIFVIAILSILLLISFHIYYPKIKGKIGEQKVAIILATLDKNIYHIYNNVLLSATNGKTSQIDHVIISKYGVFVIETKNYKGWIFGNKTSQYWTQSIWGNKYKLYNPIIQNKSHITALKRHLPMYDENQYHSIIAFSSSATLKNVTNYSCDVIYIGQVKALIKLLSDVELFTAEQVENLCNALELVNMQSKENQKMHNSTLLAHKWIQQSKVENRICPQCGGRLVLRQGRYGEFYGCSNFPKCKFTHQN